MRPLVVTLPAESVCQASKPSHLHADVKVRPLDVRRANPILIRGAGDDDLLGAYYRGGRVAALGIRRFRSEAFDDLPVVHPSPEMLLDRAG